MRGTFNDEDALHTASLKQRDADEIQAFARKHNMLALFEKATSDFYFYGHCVQVFTERLEVKKPQAPK